MRNVLNILKNGKSWIKQWAVSVQAYLYFQLFSRLNIAMLSTIIENTNMIELIQSIALFNFSCFLRSLIYFSYTLNCSTAIKSSFSFIGTCNLMPNNTASHVCRYLYALPIQNVCKSRLMKEMNQSYLC